MSVPIRLRRPLVVLGVLLSLLTGAATIQAAAAWTAASSPLAAKPPSVESLQNALATEQARSAALQDQLDELSAGSADLTTALEVARDRIASDTAHATELQASLEAARAKLAALEKSISQARTAGRGSGGRATATAAPARSHEAGEDDHEEGEDD